MKNLSPDIIRAHVSKIKNHHIDEKNNNKQKNKKKTSEEKTI